MNPIRCYVNTVGRIRGEDFCSILEAIWSSPSSPLLFEQEEEQTLRRELRLLPLCYLVASLITFLLIPLPFLAVPYPSLSRSNFARSSTDSLSKIIFIARITISRISLGFKRFERVSRESETEALQEEETVSARTRVNGLLSSRKRPG